MHADRTSASEPAGEARYEIRVRGHLDDRRSASFEGFTVEREAEGSTLLVGDGVDQAALHGALRQIRDLGLTLLAVARVGSAPEEPTSRGRAVPGEREVGS